MQDEACRLNETDGDPRRRAVVACAPLSIITMSTITMTTKTSRRAAEVM